MVFANNARPRRAGRWAASLFFLVGITGCGGVGDVHGKITYKGKPVSSGAVLILDGNKQPHYGPLQKDGSFSISRVVRGEALLAVNSPDPRSLVVDAPLKFGEKQPAVTPPANADDWFPLPPKAGDPLASGLKITVRGGHNAVDIDLKDD